MSVSVASRVKAAAALLATLEAQSRAAEPNSVSEAQAQVNARARGGDASGSAHKPAQEPATGRIHEPASDPESEPSLARATITRSSDKPTTVRSARPGGLSLKGRALKYLSAREHSRLELTRKLAPHAESPEQVAALLDDFEAKGLLSAQRFVDSVLHRKAARFGAARLQAELAQHQLPPEMARQATAALRDTEFERAHALWARRYGEPAPTPQEQARQMRFLAARGFSGEVIRRVVRGEGFTQT